MKLLCVFNRRMVSLGYHVHCDQNKRTQRLFITLDSRYKVTVAELPLWCFLLPTDTGTELSRTLGPHGLLSRVYTPCARIRAHTPTVGAAVYTSVAGCAQRIRRLSAQLFILLSPVAPSAYARIRRLSPSKFKHVELSGPAQTSADIPAYHVSAPRSPRADALFCIGKYADVYRRIRSPVYTFIHGVTCAMQWRAQAVASVDICAGCRRIRAHEV